MKCNKCGNEIQENEEKCSKCGNIVEKDDKISKEDNKKANILSGITMVLMILEFALFICYIKNINLFIGLFKIMPIFIISIYIYIKIQYPKNEYMDLLTSLFIVFVIFCLILFPIIVLIEFVNNCPCGPGKVFG